MRHTICRALACALVLEVGALALRAAGDSGPRQKDQAALKPFGSMVGSWKGTGQPERGKAKGSWRETAAWSWKLSNESAALELTVEKGKYLKTATLRPGESPRSYVLDATLADGGHRTFKGRESDRKPPSLVLTAESGDGLRRITLTPLHDTRLIVKLEAQEGGGSSFYQLAEIGYTREGVAFATGESGPVCIVTEGRGTMPVTYKGKTYYVCCSGCRDLFKENPEAVLADAAQRDRNKEKK